MSASAHRDPSRPSRGVSSYSRQALALGAAVTGAVVVGEWIGLFDGLENETIDARFAHGRWAADPMSDDVRFVDIDDGALESIGRWPWDRSRLADAVDEMRRAGARTVAMDLLLEDAQSPYRGDDDALLAEALASVRCVLPVRAGEPLLMHEVWLSSRGRAEFDRLIDVLSRDIRLSADEAAEAARLTGHRYGRFRARPLEFKKAAADAALRRLERQVAEPTWAQFLAEVAPSIGPHVGDFPERVLLERRFEQHRSWRVLQRFLHAPETFGSYRDRAPLPRFAAQAGAVGFVNVHFRQDPDAELRTVAAAEPARGGRVLQFGLAAAALHRGLAAEDVRIEPGRIRLGPIELPLEDGRVRIAWPTTRGDWENVLRRTDFDRPTAGRVSIAVLASLAEQRRSLAENGSRLRELAAFVLNRDLPEEAPLDADLLAEADAEAAFQLETARELQAQGAALTEAEAETVSAYERWPLLRRAIREGAARLASAEGRLAAELDGKLVFVGMTATGTAADMVHTPLGAMTPGVVAHAVVADMVLTGRRVVSAPGWTAWVLALVLGLACTGLSARLPQALAAVFVTAGLVGYTGVAVWLFGSVGGILPLAAPLAAGAGSWTACTALQAALFQRDRQRIARRFRTRVSPQLVDYLLENPRALSVAGEQREVTVLFLDIAGFTAITESVEVPVIVRALNRCMGEFTRCITDREGYVNKFLGDGLMAFWSAFSEDPEQASRACAAALECRAALGRLNGSAGFDALPALKARIGIATGRAIVGDCGAPPQLNDYTVIGNDVNLAARLESANKQFGTGILITGSTHHRLAPGAYRTRPIGRVIVVGRSEPVMVHELLAADADDRLVALTAEAVEAFTRGDCAASARAWHRLEQACGPSRLASFYLAAMEDEALAADGALRLQEK